MPDPLNPFVIALTKYLRYGHTMSQPLADGDGVEVDLGQGWGRNAARILVENGHLRYVAPENPELSYADHTSFVEQSTLQNDIFGLTPAQVSKEVENMEALHASHGRHKAHGHGAPHGDPHGHPEEEELDAVPPVVADQNPDRVVLAYQDGTADKVYEVEVMASAGGWVVNFAYGRRGGNLKQGTKTPQPVTETEARRIFAEVVEEKETKGYVREDLNGPTAADTLEPGIAALKQAGLVPTKDATGMAVVHKGKEATLYGQPGNEKFMDFVSRAAVQLGEAEAESSMVPWDCYDGVCVFGTKADAHAAYASLVGLMMTLTDKPLPDDLEGEGFPLMAEYLESPAEDVGVVIAAGYYEMAHPKFLKFLGTLKDVGYYQAGANTSDDMAPDECFQEKMQGDYGEVWYTGKAGPDSPFVKYLETASPSVDI